MDHEPVLITTIAIGLTAAFIGGFIARRLRPAGHRRLHRRGRASIGPFTPGFVADQDIATELAELGVILLMFGVGIHFSIRDLLAVRVDRHPRGRSARSPSPRCSASRSGSPSAGASAAGSCSAWPCRSRARSSCCGRSMDRGDLDTPQGRIAVGWLIVEDLFTVVVLVLLPTIAPLLGGDASTTTAASRSGRSASCAIALGKAAVFAVADDRGRRAGRAVAAPPGRAREGSRELFTLAVLAIALGIAYLSSAVFGVSFALGAFLAGAVVGESDMSHQAAADALPLRDAFAVLFFVSVGMLLDPAFLLAQPLADPGRRSLLIVVGQGARRVRHRGRRPGYPVRVGLTVAAGLAQIGEFSFILGTLGLSLGLLPPDGFQLIVAGALLSITVNPFLFRADRPARGAAAPVGPLRRPDRPTGRRPGPPRPRHGRGAPASTRSSPATAGSGGCIAPALERRGFRYVVITPAARRGRRACARAGVPAVFGDATNPEVLELAHLERARVLVIASAEPHEARLDRRARPRRSSPTSTSSSAPHSDTEAARLRAAGPRVQPIHGERELAVQMARYALRRFGVSATEAEAIAQGLRDRSRGDAVRELTGGGGYWPSDAGVAAAADRGRCR